MEIDTLNEFDFDVDYETITKVDPRTNVLNSLDKQIEMIDADIEHSKQGGKFIFKPQKWYGIKKDGVLRVSLRYATIRIKLTVKNGKDAYAIRCNDLVHARHVLERLRARVEEGLFDDAISEARNKHSVAMKVGYQTRRANGEKSAAQKVTTH